MIKKPKVLYTTLESGSKLIRFDNLEDSFYYDERENNPDGLGFNRSYGNADYYKNQRFIINSTKKKIIDRAQREMKMDKEFLDLVYKAKSAKREFKLNRFGGNLSMPHYASNSEKIFKKNSPGAKKKTLNMAFQVGTFVGGNYTGSFVKILKTILMCQAMNIQVNIDMFDSDTAAIGGGPGYIIINVAKSNEKLNLRRILVASHEEFFRFTLFNGYSASDCQDRIGTFLREKRIREDLSSRYDVIGGNTLLNPEDYGDNAGLVSRILKIGMR